VVEDLVVDDGKPEPDRGPDRTEPSEQDIRDYARKLRSLPVEQVIGEVMFTLLNAAQVKLGRRDARLLIDVVGVSLGHARGYLPVELAKQVDGMIGQLRLAQVSAEGRAAPPGPAREENDLDRVPRPPAETQTQPPPKQTPEPARGSGLWVPGR
jgi:hypothetical protein